jgi:hypothetical protein
MGILGTKNLNTREAFTIIDELWIRDYPDAYRRFLEIYGRPILFLHMGFLKRMRRHGDYPREGYAPIFDLRTGKVSIGLKFKVLKSSEVDILMLDMNTCPDPEAGRIEPSIYAAWNFYLGQIERTVHMYYENI